MNVVAEPPPLVAPSTLITADELLRMPDGKRFELVNGELVERNTDWESERIGTNLLGRLWQHCESHGLGVVNGSSASYRCFSDVYPDDPDRTRRPDVSFIRMDRLRAGQLTQGHCDIVPDLAVEVISPNDLYGEVEDKVEEYLAAGVRLVWVIYPPHTAIRIHRANGSVQDLKANAELTGEDVIPGFCCPISELFRLPVQAMPT